MSTIASLSGEHDISTVADLSETLAALIAGNDSGVILDLSAVEFIDASTVGVLVRADALLGSRPLVLRAPSRPALRVLEVCGLSSLLESRAGSDRGP